MHSLVVCIRTLVGIVNLVVCTIEIVASMHTMHIMHTVRGLLIAGSMLCKMSCSTRVCMLGGV